MYVWIALLSTLIFRLKFQWNVCEYKYLQLKIYLAHAYQDTYGADEGIHKFDASGSKQKTLGSLFGISFIYVFHDN